MSSWPKFTPHHVRGALALQLLITLVLVGGIVWFYETRYQPPMPMAEQQDSLYQAFLATHQADSTQAREYAHYYPKYNRQPGTRYPARRYPERKGGGHDRPYATPGTAHAPASFPFDPNTADSTALLQLGLTPYQVRNIYKYRAKGGRYHRAEDFARLYGLTVEQWEHLAPLIVIGEQQRYLADDPARMPTAARMQEAPVPPRDTIRYPIKYQEGQTVALNTADTTMLKHIPGIGSASARRIVQRREQLGGYVSLDQLAEVDGLPDGLERWFTLDATRIQRIDCNRLTLNQLRRHPYINYYQARVIADHRRLYGPLHSLHDLELYPEFTPADLERLAPYMLFE